MHASNPTVLPHVCVRCIGLGASHALSLPRTLNSCRVENYGLWLLCWMLFSSLLLHSLPLGMWLEWQKGTKEQEEIAQGTVSIEHKANRGGLNEEEEVHKIHCRAVRLSAAASSSTAVLATQQAREPQYRAGRGRRQPACALGKPGPS